MVLGLLQTLLLCGLVSITLCYLVLVTKPAHIAITGDMGGSGAQKLHTSVVPRVGGVAVVGAMAAGAVFGRVSSDVLMLCYALLPCFVFGLAEDLTKKISPFVRYIATSVSALIFCLTFDVYIRSVGVYGVDWLFGVPAIAVLFTVFAVGSIAHAFNLIDGQNGLCSGSTIIAMLALAAVAEANSLDDQMSLALLCAIANAGFLMFNYPYGKIFLGDAGAYINGALTGILAVWIVHLAPNISPWFAVSVLIYPVWETLFSIWRRKRSGKALSEPDNEHLHSLIFRGYQRRTVTLMTRSSAPKLWLAYAVVCSVAVLFNSNTAIQVVNILVFILIYQIGYRQARKKLN